MSDMVDVDVFGKIGPMTGLTVAAALRHIDRFAIGINIAGLEDAADFMAGRASVMNLRIARGNRRSGWPADVGTMTTIATAHDRYSHGMIGRQFAKGILMTLNTVAGCGITEGGDMMDSASGQGELGNMAIMTG